MEPKFLETASHLRFWGSSMLFQFAASGLSACCCGALNSFHALGGATGDAAAEVKARDDAALAAGRGLRAGKFWLAVAAAGAARPGSAGVGAC
jgi:hypothetical protein